MRAALLLVALFALFVGGCGATGKLLDRAGDAVVRGRAATRSGDFAGARDAHREALRLLDELVKAEPDSTAARGVVAGTAAVGPTVAGALRDHEAPLVELRAEALTDPGLAGLAVARAQPDGKPRDEAIVAVAEALASSKRGHLAVRVASWVTDPAKRVAILVAGASGLDKAAALVALDQAAAAARAIDIVTDRSPALERVVVALAASGNTRRAMELTRTILEPAARLRGMAAIGDALIEGGDGTAATDALDEAVKALELVDDSTEGSSVRISLARAYGRGAAVDGTKTLLTEVVTDVGKRPPLLRDPILARALRAAVWTGDAEPLTRVAQAIDQDDVAVDALAAAFDELSELPAARVKPALLVAFVTSALSRKAVDRGGHVAVDALRELARRGFVTELRSVLEEVRHPEARVRALAGAGPAAVPEAEGLVETIFDAEARAAVWVDLALAMAATPTESRRLLDRAHATAEGAETVAGRVLRWLAIAARGVALRQRQVTQNALQQAQKHADAVTDPLTRATGLLRGAALALDAELPALASTLLVRAAAAIDAVAFEGAKLQALLEATRLAAERTGVTADAARALAKVATGITDPGRRASVLRQAAVACVRAGAADEGLALVDAMSDQEGRDAVLEQASAALASAGRWTAALQAAKRITHATRQARALATMPATAPAEATDGLRALIPRS